MHRLLLFSSFVVLSACLLKEPEDHAKPCSRSPLDGEQEHFMLLQVTPDGRVPVVLEGGKRPHLDTDSDEVRHRKEHSPARSPEHLGFFQNQVSSLFTFVTQPHHDENLPMSTNLVYGSFIGLYVFAAGSFSRRGVLYRDKAQETYSDLKAQELPEPSNFYVHSFCTAAVSALAFGNLLVLLNVPFFLVVPWLYCGRVVAVTCWVAGFGHANGADHPVIVRAAILAGAAVGQLGASAVLAKKMKDNGVDQSIWPWVFLLMSCIGGLVAQRAVSDMSRNSLSWYEDKLQQRIVTVSQCVGYLGACYAMLWVVTEGKPMLSKTAEALSFGIIDTLFIASNGAILMRALEQNLAADSKREVSRGATENSPQHAETGSTAQCATDIREG